eukprot:SAG31_NODE_22561_length_522_cov_131.900709_1_plen_90_part_00
MGRAAGAAEEPPLLLWIGVRRLLMRGLPLAAASGRTASCKAAAAHTAVHPSDTIQLVPRYAAEFELEQARPGLIYSSQIHHLVLDPVPK